MEENMKMWRCIGCEEGRPCYLITDIRPSHCILNIGGDWVNWQKT